MLLLIIVDVLITPKAQQQRTSDSVNEIQNDVKSSLENTIAETKSIEQMNCTELNEFITSFEKGWGTAISMYNEKCS